MRTGSTWMGEILQTVLGSEVASVVDGEVFGEDQIKAVRKNIDAGRIQKQHHFIHTDVLDKLKPHDYKIITVVRNPRDILTSIAHFRMARFDLKQSVWPKRWKRGKPNLAKTIKDLYTEFAEVDLARQIKRMERGYSTRRKRANEMPYIWTSYEWMKYNTTAEIRKIVDFLGVECKSLDILVKVVNEKMFRNQGNPRALRKGTFGDWINCFDRKLIRITQKAQQTYWEHLAS